MIPIYRFLSRFFLIFSLVLGGIAVLEKLALVMGYTFLRGLYDPWRLLQIAAVWLLFFIAIQLRLLRDHLAGRKVE